MKGIAPLLLAVIVVLALLGAGGAYYVLSSSGGFSDTGTTINDIITKNVGYKCIIDLGVSYPSVGLNYEVNTAMYFHGKSLRIEVGTVVGKGIYVDPDITDENVPIYEWTSFTGKENAIKIPKSEVGERLKDEPIFEVIYNKKNWSKPLYSLLKENLDSALGKDIRQYEAMGVVKITKEDVKCTNWTPEKNYFEVPS